MLIYLMLLAIIAAGMYFLSGLHGQRLERALKIYTLGLLLGLAGCIGSISWLSSGISGNRKLFGKVNPYLFLAMFIAGILIVVVNSVFLFRDQNELNRTAKAGRSLSDVDDSDVDE